MTGNLIEKETKIFRVGLTKKKKEKSSSTQVNMSDGHSQIQMASTNVVFMQAIKLNKIYSPFLVFAKASWYTLRECGISPSVL